MAKYVGLAIKPFNDLELTDDGNLRLVTDAEAVGQHARQRLTFYKGEWFLDPGVGVDWFGRVLGAQGQRNTPVAEALIKTTILKTPGVTGIVSIDTVYDKASRGVQVRTCEVETEFSVPALI